MHLLLFFCVVCMFFFMWMCSDIRQLQVDSVQPTCSKDSIADSEPVNVMEATSTTLQPQTVLTASLAEPAKTALFSTNSPSCSTATATPSTSQGSPSGPLFVDIAHRASCAMQDSTDLPSDLSDDEKFSDGEGDSGTTEGVVSIATQHKQPLPVIPTESFKKITEREIENEILTDDHLMEIEDVKLGGQDEEDPLDPSTYSNKRLSQRDIELGLRLENIETDPNYNFPITNKRKFQPKWRAYTLDDGTIKKRQWLVYSKKNDSAYCLHCLLFGLPNQQSVWNSENGYQVWRDGHSLRDINNHETSKPHRACQVSRLNWMAGNLVSKTFKQKTNANIDHQREVLSVVIDCCKYLIEEMLAFRKNTVVEGKLPNLFKLLAKHNPDARVYLERLEKTRKSKKKPTSNFLSYRNISDLVSLMGSMVTKAIVEDINKSQKFSIILDSTQDVSKKEASTVIIRYLQTGEQAKPVERLVKVFTSADTSGASLKSKLTETLTDIGQSLYFVHKQNIIGQSMDGAGNMRGSFCGLKTLIEKECNTAFYVWCSSHRFQLVIEKSIETCPQIRDLFSVLEELYRLFNSGHKRHDVFVEKMLEKSSQSDQRKRLKRVQTTRWINKAEAVKVLLACYDEVISSLEELEDASKFDRETVTLASGLKKKLHTFNIAVTLFVVQRVFSVMNPVTVTLQGVVTDYGAVRGIINNVKEKLTKMRTDLAWEETYGTAVEFANKHDVPEPTRGRMKRKKRFMDEVGVDEPIIDYKKKLKVEVYFRVLDSLLLQLQDRFPDHNLKMVQQMAYFTHSGLIRLEKSTRKLKGKDIQDLCTYYKWDEEAVSEEVNSFSEIYKEAHKNVDMSDVIGKKDNKDKDTSQPSEEDSDFEDPQEKDTQDIKTQRLKDFWVNHGFLKPYRGLVNFSGFFKLEVVYSTLLSLAVTSCSAERAMSRIKIVKNRLRSCMSDEWLSNLLVLSSEKDVFSEISNEAIIDCFSKTTTVRKKLLEK